MKVTTYVINKWQPGQYFGLKDADSGAIIYHAPNNWKTQNGAKRWAINHGCEFVEEA